MLKTGRLLHTISMHLSYPPPCSSNPPSHPTNFQSFPFHFPWAWVAMQTLQPWLMAAAAPPLIIVQTLQSDMATDGAVSLPNVVKASIPHPLSHSTKWRAAIRNCREWNRHGRLSTLTSPFSYLTFHRGCSCSWFRRGCLQILFSFTAWSSFLLSNSDEAQLGKGSGLHLQRFHLITCLNSSEREISKMDWWKTIKMFPSFFLWPYTFTNRHVHDRG